MKSVRESRSVTLDSGFTELMDDDLIQWRFWIENTLIAQINVTADRFTVYDDDVPDGIFRGRLKLDNQTGSLTITNTIIQHTGLYKLQSNSVNKTFSLTVLCEFILVLPVFFDFHVSVFFVTHVNDVLNFNLVNHPKTSF